MMLRVLSLMRSSAAYSVVVLPEPVSPQTTTTWLPAIASAISPRFALAEAMTYAASNFMDLMCRVVGITEPKGRGQSVETPSVEPTRDGYVGFCTNTAQQFSDFLLLIGRDDLREDRALFQVAGRGSFPRRQVF